MTIQNRRCDGCNRRKAITTIVPDTHTLFVGSILCDPCLLKVAKTPRGLRELGQAVASFKDGVYGVVKYGQEG